MDILVHYHILSKTTEHGKHILQNYQNIFRRNYIRAYQKYGYTVDNIKDFLFPLEEIFNKLLNIIKH